MKISENRGIKVPNNNCNTIKLMKRRFSIISARIPMDSSDWYRRWIKSRNSRKYNVGIVDRKIIPSSTTNQRIYSEASQFAGTNNTYEKFNNAVAAQKLNKRTANNVYPQQKTLPDLENPRGLIISLFSAEEEEIVLDNNQQAVFEVGDKYVVAYCTRVQEEGIVPVEQRGSVAWSTVSRRETQF